MDKAIIMLPAVIMADTVLSNIKNRTGLQGRKFISAVSSGASFLMGAMTMKLFTKSDGLAIMATIGISKAISQYVGVWVSEKLDKEETLLFTALVGKETPTMCGAIRHKNHVYYVAHSKKESSKFIDFYGADCLVHSTPLFEKNY